VAISSNVAYQPASAGVSKENEIKRRKAASMAAMTYGVSYGSCVKAISVMSNNAIQHVVRQQRSVSAS